MKDPYEVLGVPKDASQDEIKSAYRRLARTHHPDVNPDDPSAEERFKEVGEAYGILSDPEKRGRFDRFGTVEEMPTDPFFGGAGGIADIFNVFFGGGFQAQRQNGRDGDDIRADVSISLQEVVTGAHREVKVRRMAQCPDCSGLGTENGVQPETCSQCMGAGTVSQIRNTFIGTVRTSTTCPKCRGAGTFISSPCGKCKGQGIVPESARVSVNIPPGIETGSTIHMPGQGSEGTGMGRPGDLFVVVEVEDDPRFERHGRDLVGSVAVTFPQACLGDNLEIEGVDGKLKITVPSGCQPGDLITISGAGLPPLHGGRRGDLVIEMTVKVPTTLNEEQKSLIKQLDLTLGRSKSDRQQDDDGGFLGKLFRKKK